MNLEFGENALFFSSFGQKKKKPLGKKRRKYNVLPSATHGR
jgi:hypothetical protein